MMAAMVTVVEALRGRRVVVEFPAAGVGDWMAVCEVLVQEGIHAWAFALPDAAGKTAGTLLREARLACGMDLSELARILKVPERKLEALEADRYAELQSMTFVRALALSACRVMRAEAAPCWRCCPSRPRSRCWIRRPWA